MDAQWFKRQVSASDSTQVAAHGCYREEDTPRRPLYASWVRPRIEAGTYIGWLAFDGSAVIGGAGAVLLDWGPTRANPCGTKARIVNVFTEPGWRGRGVARSLIEAVMTTCEGKGVREFNLAATAEGRGLYSALGFESYPAEMRRRVALQ
jgi:GNAT superfamily N-acetyltransferase